MAGEWQRRIAQRHTAEAAAKAAKQQAEAAREASRIAEAERVLQTRNDTRARSDGLNQPVIARIREKARIILKHVRVEHQLRAMSAALWVAPEVPLSKLVYEGVTKPFTLANGALNTAGENEASVIAYDVLVGHSVSFPFKRELYWPGIHEWVGENLQTESATTRAVTDKTITSIELISGPPKAVNQWGPLDPFTGIRVKGYTEEAVKGRRGEYSPTTHDIFTALIPLRYTAAGNSLSQPQHLRDYLKGLEGAVGKALEDDYLEREKKVGYYGPSRLPEGYHYLEPDVIKLREKQEAADRLRAQQIASQKVAQKDLVRAREEWDRLPWHKKIFSERP